MNTIGKVVFIVVLSGLFIMNAANANAIEEYQMAISNDYFYSEDDENNKFMGYGIFVRQYFSPVNTFEHPLAEAAFLERVGSFGLLVISSESEFSSPLGMIDVDRLSYGAFATFRKPRIPLSLDLSFSQSDARFDTIFIGDTATKRYLVDIGLFILEGVRIDLEYAYSETRNDSVFFSGTTSKNTSYALQSKIVKKFPNDHAMNFQAEIGIDEFEDLSEEGQNTIIELIADYYFNRFISLGGSVELNRGDRNFSEGESYEVNLLAFLNSHFSVAFSYGIFSADNTAGIDVESYRVFVSVRL
ncbi:putative porin [Nitrospira defluvii]|nr:putative porin [Nitrospira defluvii]